MYSRKQKGQLGEISAIKYFVQLGYEVFTPMGDNGSVDFVVMKDSALQTVSVKTTSTGQVELRNVSRRSNNEVVVTKFKSCDILAVYDITSDTVHIFNGKDYEGKSSLTLRKIIQSGITDGAC